MATLIDIAQRRTERHAGHPSVGDLQNFAAGRLDARRLLAVSSHLLTRCGRCRRILRDSFGLEQHGAAPYRIHAPAELVDRLRALAEISPERLRLALDNLAGSSATLKAAAALEARGQVEDRDVAARLLIVAAEYLLETVETKVETGDPRVSDDEALLLGRLAFDLDPAGADSEAIRSVATIIERSWKLVTCSGDHSLAQALLLSASAFVERAVGPSAGHRRVAPRSGDPLQDLVEAQRLFALAPSTIEHALSTFALAGLVLESPDLDEPELLVELSRSLAQQEERLHACGEHGMAGVAVEYRLAIEIHAENWGSALTLVEQLIRRAEDQGDLTAALRLQAEAARIHRALDDDRRAMTRMRIAKDGLLINGYALESAFAALELAEMELEAGRSACRSLAGDLLPIFAAIEDREAVAVLLMIRDAALAGTLNVAQLRESRALLFELTSA